MVDEEGAGEEGEGEEEEEEETGEAKVVEARSPGAIEAWVAWDRAARVAARLEKRSTLRALRSSSDLGGWVGSRSGVERTKSKQSR